MEDLTVFSEGTYLGGKYQILRALEDEAPDRSSESGGGADLTPSLPPASRLIPASDRPGFRPGSRCYLARDSVEGRSWVLRQLALPADEEERRAFSRAFYAEGEREAAVQHRSLPRVAEFFLEKGFAWAVSELVEGIPLPGYSEPVSDEQARKWLRSLADGLHVLHESDPPLPLGGFPLDHVVVTAKGRARLTTLGIARLFPPGVDADEGRRADVQALGAVGFRLLTGKYPGPGLRELRPEVDDDLATIVERCLGVGSEPPFATTTEVCAALSGRAREEAENPPRLGVAPERLELTHVSQDGVAVTAFMIVNRGGGTLTGTVKAADPWVKVSPETFEGNDVEVQVWTEAAAFAERDEVASAISVHAAGETREIPLAIVLQKSALARLPSGVLALVLLAVAGIPTAAVLAWKLAAVDVAGTFLTSAGQAVAPGAGLLSAAASAWHALQVQEVLAWALPVGALLIHRQLPARLQRRLRLPYALALVLPSLILWLAFRHAALPVGIERNAVLRALNPLYGFALFAGTDLLAALLLLLPEERYPGLLRSAVHLRWALIFVLAVVWLKLYGRVAFS